MELLGVPLARLTAEEALDRVVQLYERPEPALVAYANAHTLNLASSDTGYRELLRRADIVLNDGSGVGIAAWMKRARFPENLNGTDLNPRILAVAARRGWPVFFLGAAPGVAEAAAGRLRDQIPELVVCGCRHGYFPSEAGGEVADEVRAAGAGLVMVAMGNPLQEQWLDRYLYRSGARLGVGVGAFFDFSAGVARRAPTWMNRAGIEWVHRLAMDPRRLWKRYLLGNPLFFFRLAKEGMSSRRSA